MIQKNKITNRYLFLARRIVDVDHMVPVIDALISAKVPTSNICYRVCWPHPSLYGSSDDFRLDHLEKRGVSLGSLIKSPYIAKSRRVYDEGWIGWFRGLLLSRYGIHIVKLVCLLDMVMSIKWIGYRGGVVMMDKGTIPPYLLVSFLAKWMKIRTLVIPSGVNFDQAVFPDIVATNKVLIRRGNSVVTENVMMYRGGSQRPDGVELFGSPRYGKEWIAQLTKLLPTAPKTKEPVTILYLLDKESRFDTHSLVQILDYILDKHDTKIIAKGHPRSPRQKLPKFLEKYSHMPNRLCYVTSDKFSSTFELVMQSDIVLSTGGAALLDALLLERHTIVPLYCTHRKLLMENYPISSFVKSFSEAKVCIDKIVVAARERQKPKELAEYRQILNDVALSYEEPVRRYLEWLTE